MLTQDKKYKKHIGNYLLEFDHYSSLITIRYKGDLLRAYDTKVSEVDNKFDYYKEKLQKIAEKQAK
jgi:hypothetical protein